MIKTKSKSSSSASAPTTRVSTNTLAAVAPNRSGITSSINGTFASTYEHSAQDSHWSLSHSRDEKFIKFGVDVVVDGEHQQLESAMGLDEINQLFNWLYQAKATIQKKVVK